jgi:hypothetical protein
MENRSWLWQVEVALKDAARSITCHWAHRRASGRTDRIDWFRRANLPLSVQGYREARMALGGSW